LPFTKTQAVRGIAPASGASHVRRAARLTLAFLPEYNCQNPCQTTTKANLVLPTYIVSTLGLYVQIFEKPSCLSRNHKPIPKIKIKTVVIANKEPSNGDKVPMVKFIEK
jgi:hypothetical protein